MKNNEIREYWKNYFEQQKTEEEKRGNLTVKEYCEIYGAPEEAEIFAAVFRAGEHTERLSEIKAQILQIDRRALGRYLGRKSGFRLGETAEEFMLSNKAGYLYERLLAEAADINRSLQEK